MTRLARVVIPECPHHIIQRGNHRERVFFSDSDRLLYLRLLKFHGKKRGVSFWAYCLMDNHVHLVAMPKLPNSLARGLGEAHRKYTNLVNIREDWKGHLWQGRFVSYPLDESHLFAAIRYIERNPVRAGIVSTAEDYPWSSARAHMQGIPDPLISLFSQLPSKEDWAFFLKQPDEDADIRKIREHELSERPLGDEQFIKQLEETTGRFLGFKKRGRKKGN